MGNGEAYYIT